MSDHSLSPVGASAAPRACATITAAFAEDPVERWLFPEPDDYAVSFPAFVAAAAYQAFEAGTAWQLGDFAAVSLWLPPSTQPDAERIGAVLLEVVAREKHHDLFALLAKMDERHPRTPHWYLPWLGVMPSAQNRGVGSELMIIALEYVDRSGLPVHLETGQPRNIPFFERHGFVVTERVQEGDCPPLTFMVREARGA